jgi:hypothetical protein
MGSEQEKKAQDPGPSSHRVEADRDLSAWLRTGGPEYGRAGRGGQQPNAPNSESLRCPLCGEDRLIEWADGLNQWVCLVCSKTWQAAHRAIRG